MGQQFIDFKWVVENADVEAVLNGLDCEVARKSGDEIRLHGSVAKFYSVSVSL